MTDPDLARLLPDRAVAVLRFAARPGESVPFPPGLNPGWESALARLTGGDLYRHQGEAIRAGLEGRDLLVTTGTGSGKSLCAVAPLVQSLLQEPAGRALAVFPTKALAQDQATKLAALVGPLGLRVATYDGDTPRAHRSAIRRACHIVVTNPDMLHVGILPQHELWSAFLRNLRVVLLDELHVYRGLFGAHASGVFHRLLRLAHWSKSRPQVFSLSATLGQPSQVLADLLGREAHLVTVDASPKGEQEHALVAPAEAGSGSPGPNAETALLTAEVVRCGGRVLTFCRSRVAVELVTREVRRLLGDEGRVEGYRSGYTPEERRDIERRMHGGELEAVVATNALELGIDLGGLDAVVMNGYPGSVTSYWQQAGRAGRAGRPGRSYMIAHPDAAEAAVSREPQRYLVRGFDGGGPAVRNRIAVKAQLTCAAYERALGPEEVSYFGPVAEAAASDLVDEATLVPSAGRLFYPSHSSPSLGVTLRGSMAGAVELLENGRLIGTMEPFRALGYAHPGAVYLHRGESYEVSALDWARKRAELTPCQDDVYTRPFMSGVVEPGDRLASKSVGRLEVGLWRVQVTTTAVAYSRVALPSHQVLAILDLEMPVLTLDTVAVRIELPQPTETEDLPVAATHTLEHALSALTPLLTGASSGDTMSAWYALSPDTLRPCVWVYDVAEGGSGLAESLFSQAAEWLSAARQLAEACPCEDGCPLCVLSSQCESRNEAVSKGQMSRLLRAVGIS